MRGLRCYTLDMVIPNVFLKPFMSTDVKLVDVNVDVGNQFTNGQEFVVCDHMLQWTYKKTTKLEFSIVIKSSDNGSYRRLSFVTPECKRSGKYTTQIRKLKRDDTNSRKCEYTFKLY